MRWDVFRFLLVMLIIQSSTLAKKNGCVENTNLASVEPFFTVL